MSETRQFPSSSSIASATYDPPTLVVTFKSGRVATHTVTPSQWSMMKNAPSVGGFYEAQVSERARK